MEGTCLWGESTCICFSCFLGRLSGVRGSLGGRGWGRSMGENKVEIRSMSGVMEGHCVCAVNQLVSGFYISWGSEVECGGAGVMG